MSLLLVKLNVAYAVFTLAWVVSANPLRLSVTPLFDTLPPDMLKHSASAVKVTVMLEFFARNTSSDAVGTLAPADPLRVELQVEVEFQFPVATGYLFAVSYCSILAVVKPHNEFLGILRLNVM